MSGWSITKYIVRFFVATATKNWNLLLIFQGTYFDIAETGKGIFRNAWFRDLTKKMQ